MKKVNYVLFICAAALMVACGPGRTGDDTELSDSPEIVPGLPSETLQETESNAAMASISPASGSQVTGTATFTQLEDGKVHMILEVENLSPGDHALHLHVDGDCSAPDATSAGDHWNPTDDEHGKRGTNGYHQGDISNISVGEDGIGRVDMEIEGWTIGDGSDSDILDKAVIIHADPDDFVSQPSGAAGERIACGVIEVM